MSHAQVLTAPPHPASAASDAVIDFVQALRYGALPEDVRHYARRHLLDTVGVMIAGAAGEIVARAEAMLSAVRPPGEIAVPGRARRADLLDAAFLGGTAAHAVEFDDGFREGSVHPGCVVVPAVLALAHARHVSGAALMEAMVAGYETVIAIARACHPNVRRRGFHPTGVVGVLGSAMAAGKLNGLSREQLANALGLAASSAGGLFAFVNGGADVKRLHAGHAAREGLQAVLLAAQGVEGPPNVMESRDGFMQAFTFDDGAGNAGRVLRMPPHGKFGVTDCYIKPYPCCRHIQPALEAFIGILSTADIAGEEVEAVEVATYRIAAEHAHTPWDDFAGAQLSFPYLMGLALRFRSIRLEQFSESMRADPWFAAFARKLEVIAPAEIDRRYPQLRPARVTVRTRRGEFTRQRDEALGSRLVPLDDGGLKDKFMDLAGPVIGAKRAGHLQNGLWAADQLDDAAPLVEMMATPADTLP